MTSDSPSESDGLSDTLNNGTVKLGGGLVTESVVASTVFIEKLLEVVVGGAVVDGVGGTTDIVLVTAADVMIGGAADVVIGVAADVVTGGAADVMIGGAADVVTGGATDVVTGGATDVVTGGAADVMGGAADVVISVAAGVVTGGATDVVTGEAADVVTGGATDVAIGVAADAVMGVAVVSVMGRIVDSVMGGAAEPVMGMDVDLVVGGAADVLVVTEEISLIPDLVVEGVGNESAIRVGGAADTMVEDKVVVDEITLEVGRVIIAAIEVGRAALEATVTTLGLLMDKVSVTVVAENVTEDSTVVAAIMGVAIEPTGADAVDKEDTTDLLLSDKIGVAAVALGGLVKVTPCSSSDSSLSSPLVSSLFLFCALKGFVRVSCIPVVLEFSEKSKLLGFIPEVVTAASNKLVSDFDNRPLSGGLVLLAGFGKLVSDFENRLPKEALLSLLVDKPNVREV